MDVLQALAQAKPGAPVILEFWERGFNGADRLYVRHFVRDGGEWQRLSELARGYVVVRYGENWSEVCTAGAPPGLVPPGMDYGKGATR